MESVCKSNFNFELIIILRFLILLDYGIGILYVASNDMKNFSFMAVQW